MQEKISSDHVQKNPNFNNNLIIDYLKTNDGQRQYFALNPKTKTVYPFAISFASLDDEKNIYQNLKITHSLKSDVVCSENKKRKVPIFMTGTTIGEDMVNTNWSKVCQKFTKNGFVYEGKITVDGKVYQPKKGNINSVEYQ